MFLMASKATKKRLKKDSKIDLGLDREDCLTFSVLNEKKISSNSYLFM